VELRCRGRRGRGGSGMSRPVSVDVGGQRPVPAPAGRQGRRGSIAVDQLGGDSSLSQVCWFAHSRGGWSCSPRPTGRAARPGSEPGQRRRTGPTPDSSSRCGDRRNRRKTTSRHGADQSALAPGPGGDSPDADGSLTSKTTGAPEIGDEREVRTSARDAGTVRREPEIHCELVRLIRPTLSWRGDSCSRQRYLYPGPNRPLSTNESGHPAVGRGSDTVQRARRFRGSPPRASWYRSG